VGIVSHAAQAQGNLARRLNRLLDAPPFDRASWGVVVSDTTGRVLYERNADRLFVPASNAKLVVTATALALLPVDYRIVTSVYGTGPLINGALHGDLVVYGRGDPMYSQHCYRADTLSAGVCDSMWTRMEQLADSIVARGVRQVDGSLVGDGSYFEDPLVNGDWSGYDLNWWYAAPVSGLGFNDNSLNIAWHPGVKVGMPAVVHFEPDLQNFEFENRTRTVDSSGPTTIDFFRVPGTMRLWAEGNVSVSNSGRTEYFAVPDPNLFFVQALRASLARRGVAIAGPNRGTTDSMAYHDPRTNPALAQIASRPLSDLLYPILNSSQNWFAETLLKLLGRERGPGGSWDGGLAVERAFLKDSVKVDTMAFTLADGSGLSSSNLVTPRAFVQILRYVRQHPSHAAFLRALPRAGQPGSLKDRFAGTAVEGRVQAKTGSINHVNSLSGFVQQPNGRTMIFAIVANNHAAHYRDALAQIDSVVVEVGR
jgi:D-alanyl-D-alanine carboxypeptidase/D-alanyl-D-alanine-endopeptidase (penicillin-binding protein 4)